MEAEGRAHSAKALSDLQDLVEALAKALPRGKPWQRQLHVHLCEVDRLMQILRVLNSLGRDAREVGVAIGEVQHELRAANAYVAAGRTDMGTSMAVQVAAYLGKQLTAKPG